jgi:glucose/mannose-6-phosphate isomerase
MSSRTRPGRGAIDLDDRTSYQHLDPGGMLAFAVDFPAQAERAAQIGRAFRPAASLRQPEQIVLAGMGGSAVSGDFLARLCEHQLPLPFVVSRDYRIPRFVGPGTLFIASSYSGNTEETLAAAALALRRRARVICITTGGKLQDFARRRGLPLIALPQTDPPMPPRAAWGYSFIPLVFVLRSLGLYPGAERQMREAMGLLSRLRDQVHPDVPLGRNRAKQLATALAGSIPWVHGTAGIMAAAAYRWRCQFNENSKTLACSAEYPELNHNEVVGWELPRALARSFTVVVLRRPDDSPRVKARVEITRELIGPKAPMHEIEAEGESPLAQLLWTVYLGDFISLYLAFLHRADPAEIMSINELKGRLAKL